MKVKVSGLPDLSNFLEIGATAAEAEELPFLSFARPVKSTQPRRQGEGSAGASGDALHRWERDCYRVPPYQYERRNLVHGPGNSLRRLQGDEMGRMLGFTSHHMSAVGKAFRRDQVEDQKQGFCANSFSAVVVARLLGSAVLPFSSQELDRGTLPQIWHRWGDLETKANLAAAQLKKGWTAQHGGPPAHNRQLLRGRLSRRPRSSLGSICSWRTIEAQTCGWTRGCPTGYLPGPGPPLTPASGLGKFACRTPGLLRTTSTFWRRRRFSTSCAARSRVPRVMTSGSSSLSTARRPWVS